MIRASVPARWRLPLIAGGLLAASVAVPALGADLDARTWLARMTEALASRNYEGEFLHLGNGQVERMRILHRVAGGHVTERLISLSGSGREIVRDDSGVYCYLPDHKKVLVQPRDTHEPLLPTLTPAGSELERSYRVETLGRSMSLIGRPARIVSVTPRDQFRFGHRLWIDEASHIPVRTDLCDAGGRVLEQVLFTSLIIRKSLSEDMLKPSVNATGYSWIRQGPSSRAIDATAWRLAHLPPGFHISSAAQELLLGGTRPVTHLVVTDGFASVSVFIADPDGRSAEGQGHLGSSFAYSTLVSGHRVTAVGEVPELTVETIAAGVEPNAPPPH